MKYHTAVTLEPIRGRDDRIAGSGMVQLYRYEDDPQGGKRHVKNGEPIKVLNLSTMPIRDGVTVQIAEHDEDHFIVDCETE